MFRDRIIVLLAAIAGAFVILAAAAAGAVASTCPRSSTSTVTGSPSYTHTRGCILSFDGTAIVYNLFEPLHPTAGSVYPILEGPGWGAAGATSPDPNLISGGYAELTWDPRGFGQSGGAVEFDAPSFEGRDVSALIDQVLTGRPEIATDRAGADGQPRYSNDSASSNSYGRPVVGMTGGSYGGAIQFATAAFDDRVKAIVPRITWNDLNYSLWPGGVIKSNWDNWLYALGRGESAGSHGVEDLAAGTGGQQTGGYDPNIDYAVLTGGALGHPDRRMLDWFGQRSQSMFGAGPGGHIGEVPTLLIQGTVDTLFNLNDAWANYVEITGRYPRLPVKLVAFCGGHVTCPGGYRDTASASSPIGPGQSAAAFQENRTIDWFNHYLRGQGAGDGMPDTVVYQDQTGNWIPLSSLPTPSAPGPGTYVTTRFSGMVVAHGVPTGAGEPGVNGAFTDGPTSPADPGQLTVPLLTAPRHSDVPIVGIGHVSADAAVAGAPAELFFRLIDKRTGGVVDCQTEPWRLDGSTGKLSLDLAGIAYDLPAGDTLELQISTSTDSYMPNRGAATVTLSNGSASIPTLGSPPLPAPGGGTGGRPSGVDAGATGGETSRPGPHHAHANPPPSRRRRAWVGCTPPRPARRAVTVTCKAAIPTRFAWRLVRGGRTVERGVAVARRGEVALRFGRLRAARYTLWVVGWRRGMPFTVRYVRRV